MYIIVIKEGSIKEPQTFKEMQDQAKGLLTYQDCFIGKNYEGADAFIIRVIGLDDAFKFATLEQANAYANFLKTTNDFSTKEIIIKELVVKLESVKSTKKEEK